jgi:hypothetical protein
MYRELVSALCPTLGLSRVLTIWPEITRRLADTPRLRKRAKLS